MTRIRVPGPGAGAAKPHPLEPRTPAWAHTPIAETARSSPSKSSSSTSPSPRRGLRFGFADDLTSRDAAARTAPAREAGRPAVPVHAPPQRRMGVRFRFAEPLAQRRTAPAVSDRTHSGDAAPRADPAHASQVLAVQRAAVPETAHRDAALQADAVDVHAIARQGLAGAQAALPHQDVLQRAFGEHPLTGVRVQIGGPAATASAALGARAYTAGERIAFSEPPDLHTAAHEAAHVIQQRAGLVRPGLGAIGDAHEQRADRIAGAVVAGQPVAHLLGPVRGSAPAGADASRIQREPDDRSTRLPEDAARASTSVRDPAAPAARNATWAQVQSAATDKHTQELLDVAWIETLPAHLKDSIDHEFGDSTYEQVIAKLVPRDPELAAIDSDAAQELHRLEAETLVQLAAADPAIRHAQGGARDAALARDPAFVAGKAAIEARRQARRSKRLAAIRSAAGSAMAAGQRRDTVVTPPTAQIPRLEGKALARVNFMSWATDVLGSADATKAHFRSLREVQGQPGFFLIAPAAERFEAARAAFEAAHPGYTFPSTDVGQALRRFHEARQGLGKLGHALGLAFDLLAYDNPDQRDEQGADLAYLLDRFGGEGDRRGRSQMALGANADAIIVRMGQGTMAGRTTAEGGALVDQLRAQFEEMAATSDRLRASMAAQLPVLAEARDAYFASLEVEQQLNQLNKDIANADRVVAERLRAEKFAGTQEEKAARSAAIKDELTARSKKLGEMLASLKKKYLEIQNQAFAGWRAAIDADLADAQDRQAKSDAELKDQARDRAKLDAIDVQAADALAQLKAYADERGWPVPSRPGSPTDEKRRLKAKLQDHQVPRDRRDPLSPQYLQSEIAVLRRWRDDLANPKVVFGTGQLVPAPHGAAPLPAGAGSATGDATAPVRHWKTQLVASHPSIMQLLERGFIRHDAMPDRTGKRRAEVFNAEVAATLARHGFRPGATFRDTMHFDFVEGYLAVPGGLSPANLAPGAFGPSGDLVPPALRSPAPKPKK